MMLGTVTQHMLDSTPLRGVARVVLGEAKSTHAQNAIRSEAVDEGNQNIGSVKALIGKELTSSMKIVNAVEEKIAQPNSISMHIGESVAIARMVGTLYSKGAAVMKLVNNLKKASAMAVTAIKEFTHEIIKGGEQSSGEMVNDAVNSSLNIAEDIKEKVEEKSEKLVKNIAGEAAAHHLSQLLRH